jgi:hypothetical protein
MVGLNNIREAYQQVYSQIDERMSDDEKEMRRLAAKERRAGNSDRMDPKVASKYADSETKSASREDKKSKGKHIYGMADSVELEGDQIDEISSHLALTASQKADELRRKASISGDKKTAAEKAAQASRLYKGVGPRKTRERMQSEAKDDSYLETDMDERRKNNEKAIKDMNKTKAHADMVKAARKHFEEVELDERALDTAEKGEKERLVKGMKKSAEKFKKRYGARATSVMHATATKQAKRNMDTSQSDRRYSVEEETETPTQHKTRKPSQIAKREKLTKLLDQIRQKKQGEKE